MEAVSLTQSALHESPSAAWQTELSASSSTWSTDHLLDADMVVYNQKYRTEKACQFLHHMNAGEWKFEKISDDKFLTKNTSMHCIFTSTDDVSLTTVRSLRDSYVRYHHFNMLLSQLYTIG